jgi:hypothetical protein
MALDRGERAITVVAAVIVALASLGGVSSVRAASPQLSPASVAFRDGFGLSTDPTYLALLVPDATLSAKRT